MLLYWYLDFPDTEENWEVSDEKMDASSNGALVALSTDAWSSENLRMDDVLEPRANSVEPLETAENSSESPRTP